MKMTKEEKAKMLLDVYECEKNRLQKEYKTKMEKLEMETLPFPDKDEVAKKTIDINTWYEEEAARIEHRFLKAITQMEN